MMASISFNSDYFHVVQLQSSALAGSFILFSLARDESIILIMQTTRPLPLPLGLRREEEADF